MMSVERATMVLAGALTSGNARRIALAQSNLRAAEAAEAKAAEQHRRFPFCHDSPYAKGR